jgi:hypothetical protein
MTIVRSGHFAHLVIGCIGASVLFAIGCGGGTDVGGEPPVVSPQGDASAPSADEGGPGETGDASRPPMKGGGAMSEMGGDAPAPKACTSEKDCTGGCPAEAKGCTCAQTAMGRACIPTCTTDKDCPAPPPGVVLACSAQKTCVPKGQ